MPWLTGPLLTPSAYTVPPKYWNIQPYLFYNNPIGFYDTKWENQPLSRSPRSLNFFLFLQTGLLSFMDFSIYPQFFYNFNNEASSWEFGDLSVFVSFQLLRNVPGTWIPAIRFAVGETFPTGKYQNLDPKKYGADVGGKGTFETSFLLLFSQLWHFGGDHFLADRFAIELEVSAPLSINGYSIYGGNSYTNGTVSPGISLNAFLGFEYTLTKNWALAVDVMNEFSTANTFTGKSGSNLIGFDDSSYVFSLAPAIEYNLNRSIGFIGGVWFSVMGYNAINFIDGVIAVNFYFQ